MPTPIEQLEPRQLDALIATKIMEWEQRWRGNVPETNAPEFLYPPSEMFVADDPERVPPFSTDISAAWQVVEKMGEHGYWCVLKSPFYPGAKCWAGFTPHNTTGWNGRPDFKAGDESPARAISLAALQARGVTEVEDD